MKNTFQPVSGRRLIAAAFHSMKPIRTLASSAFLLSATLFLTSCASPGNHESAGGTRPLIAVMAAFEPEIVANREALLPPGTPFTETVINGVRFTRFSFEGRDILLFSCGVSMVNAAMTTQLALDKFPVSLVMLAGIAGGINPSNHIGDVVVPEKWYYHSEAVYANPKPDGSGYIMPEFFKPHYENFQFIFPSEVSVTRDGLGKPETQPYFSADPTALQAARKALATMAPLTWSNRVAKVIVGGNGITGPVFMDNRDYRKWAFRVWGAECLEMESAAIGQVAWANHKPFIIVRTLSDLAGGQEGVNAEESTEVPVSKHASIVLREIIRALPPGKF